MNLNELKVGDTIISKKKTKWYQLLNRFFNWRIKVKAIKFFGKDVIFPSANHTRKVVAIFNDTPIIFHWTFPVAKFSIVKPWMLDSNYSIVTRYKLNETNQDEWLLASIPHDGTGYDVGELLDIELGFKRFFGVHKKHVCSTGCALLDVNVLGVQFGIPIRKVLPCMWANDKDFEIVNGEPDNTFVKLCEPKGK